MRFSPLCHNPAHSTDVYLIGRLRSVFGRIRFLALAPAVQRPSVVPGANLVQPDPDPGDDSEPKNRPPSL